MQKIILKNICSSFINNAVLRKTIENIYIIIVTTEMRTKLVSQPNNEICFWKFIMNRIFINKQIFLGQSVLEISEIIIYEFLCD